MQILQKALNWITGILFPHQESLATLLSHTPEKLALLLPKALHTPFGTALFTYKDPRTKLLITTLKYKGDRAIAKLFATLLAEHIHTYAEEYYIFNTSPLLILPIPRAPKRYQEYGFCQTTRIAQELQKLLPYTEVRFDVLFKKDTPTQTKLSKTARMQNIQNAFTVPHPEHIHGRTIILIDDVITTGSTLNEARRKLKESGGHVVECLAVGH